VHHTVDILKYQGKFNFHNRECNKTSVDKIKELRQVVDMALKSQQKMIEVPSKDTNVDAFMKLTDKIYCALKPILWEICCGSYNMFKIEIPTKLMECVASSGSGGMTPIPNAMTTPHPCRRKKIKFKTSHSSTKKSKK